MEVGTVRSVILALVVAASATTAFAQEAPAPRLETPKPAPPAVTLEARPDTSDDRPLIRCPRPQVDEQGNLKPTLEGCRVVPPKKERHPDYGKGRLYSLTPI
jgi:hypothetical protein